MALVDYESDSEASDSEPASKKRKLVTANTPSPPPPLPSTFHDLYAHTVRPSNRDDPSLHQGRRRQIPHIAGNWPSHLYVEWHPRGSEHAFLTSLLDTLSTRLRDFADKQGSDSGNAEIEIRDFLTSDLGAPLPLHISLSRPLSLSGAQKDDFLDRLRGIIAKSGVGAFELIPTSMEWHRTHESARSFLVLRVVSAAPSDGTLDSRDSQRVPRGRNVELSTLLHQCNQLCRSFGQPELYALDQKVGNSVATDAVVVGDAFHASVAWSFAEPTEELKRVTADICASAEFKKGASGMRISVDGIKAKIGNVVTRLPVTVKGNRNTHETHGRKGLFDT